MNLRLEVPLARIGQLNRFSVVIAIVALVLLHLEVLDAAFSFDGVIGAFAITTDPIIIALEHGAHWAIGALAAILLVGIGYHVNEVVTGLLGVAFVLSALASSIVRNRRPAAQGIETRKTADQSAADHARL
jgi:hypothetical protein